MKKQIQTNEAPSVPTILSQGLLVDNTLYVSGQIHNDETGKLLEGTVAEKLDRIFLNIKAILNQANMGLEDIVKVVIYVDDILILKEINEFYPNYIVAPYPVREAVCVKALPLGANIEISIVAVTKNKRCQMPFIFL